MIVPDRELVEVDDDEFDEDELEVLVDEEELEEELLPGPVLVDDVPDEGGPVVLVLPGFFRRNVTAKKLPPRIITIIAAIANTVVADAKVSYLQIGR